MVGGALPRTDVLVSTDTLGGGVKLTTEQDHVSQGLQMDSVEVSCQELSAPEIFVVPRLELLGVTLVSLALIICHVMMDT